METYGWAWLNQVSPLKEGEVSERCFLVGFLESMLEEEEAVQWGPEGSVSELTVVPRQNCQQNKGTTVIQPQGINPAEDWAWKGTPSFRRDHSPSQHLDFGLQDPEQNIQLIFTWTPDSQKLRDSKFVATCYVAVENKYIIFPISTHVTSSKKPSLNTNAPIIVLYFLNSS